LETDQNQARRWISIKLKDITSTSGWEIDQHQTEKLKDISTSGCEMDQHQT
jgi:hypothetical protein